MRENKTEKMEKSERLKIYQKACEKWGRVAQLEMAQEEATELALAIRREIRNNDEKSFLELVDEIADVEIMIEQIKMIYELTPLEYAVEERKEYKVNRLKQRIETP